MTTDDENLTKSKDVRWEYLSSVLTALVLTTFCILIVGAALGALSLSAIGQPWFLLFGALVTAAAGWLYGREYVEWKGEE